MGKRYRVKLVTAKKIPYDALQSSCATDAIQQMFNCN